jgi:nitrate reductase gamma subunit
VHHLRFFVEPVPLFVTSLQSIDGLFQLALPTFLITDGLVVIALTYLFVRRVVNPHVRYISLSSDYFPLLLIGGIAISGILMRHVIRVDLLEVKHYAMSMLTFDPTIPREVGLIFHVHLFLVCLLLAYFPFSKLMHMPGVFMSPTRNLKNDSRAKRHINPWNHPVKVHTYAEWEDEFRDALKEAGIPVEKE